MFTCLDAHNIHTSPPLGHHVHSAILGLGSDTISFMNPVVRMSNDVVGSNKDPQTRACRCKSVSTITVLCRSRSREIDPMALTVSLPSLRKIFCNLPPPKSKWNFAGDLVSAFPGRGPLLYGAEDDRRAHKDNDTTNAPQAPQEPLLVPRGPAAGQGTRS